MNGEEQSRRAGAIVAGFAEDDVVIPLQALGELFTVLIRKARWTAPAARDAVLAWHDSFEVVGTSPSVLLDAMDLVANHQFSFWDAVMFAASAQAGCRLLVSEDMHDGFTWRGVTIRNPFNPASPTA